MKFLCKIFGHDLPPLYTQPEPKFERIYNKWLGEPMWYEIFDHKCERCGITMRVWRWTKEATRKMLEDGY